MKQDRHKLNTADIITLIRMAGTLLLLVVEPLTSSFFWLYGLTGVTDALDGWIARKTNTASDFGAKLDSAADLLFYAVMLLRLFPTLWILLPRQIWYVVAVIVMVRLSAYLVAAVKYRCFASLHTKMNKLTGLAVFLLPFFLATQFHIAYCWAVCVIGAVSSAQELLIHLCSRPDSTGEIH